MQQAPETAERLGAVGGAATGAALGGLVAGPPGAAIGAIGGGIVGFFADFFGSDDDEVDQGVADRFFDALSPWAEYSRSKDGARAFFEDLGWVLTAGSLISGTKLAVSGVQAGAAAISEGAATAAVSGVKHPLLMTALQRAPVAEPGWFTRITARAMKPVVGANRVERMVDFARVNGLMAQANRPAVKVFTSAYTGASAGQLGARVSAGLGSGSSQTTIEKAIAKAPELPAYVDLLQFLVVPTQLFPVGLRRVGDAAKKLLGNTDLLPYAHTIQTGGKKSLRESMAAARAALGADDLERATADTWLRRNYGLDRMAADRLDGLKMTGVEAHAEGAFQKARAEDPL